MKGKRILIVGGGTGIGLCLAKQLIDMGAQVVIASRNIKKLERVCTELGTAASAYPLDAGDEQAVIGFYSELGEFDHLVVTIRPDHLTGPFTESAPADSRAAFDAKFWGQYILARYCLDTISAKGSIVFTSGIAAVRGYQGFSCTAAINGAIESLTKSLAVELAPIRVNAVTPGFIERFGDDTERWNMVQSLSARIPAKRLGTQIEAANAYIYLLQNQYTSGTIVTVDGGELSA
ncbi:MAG: SDR family oxidoreductase [Pseudomonadales bacterium]|nr:SDR family oxidoreductase [Pseudomonadales bacterium]